MSWRDTALDVALGKSEWERAAEGYSENDWGRLLSGAGLGALAVASIAPVGGLGRGARAGLQAGAGRGRGLVDADLLDGGLLGSNLGSGGVPPAGAGESLLVGGGPPSVPPSTPPAGRVGSPSWIDDPAYASPAEGTLDDVMARWANDPPPMPGEDFMPAEVPGIRGAVPGDEIDGMRDLLAERSRQFQEQSFLANPANIEDLARGLAAVEGIDDAILHTHKLTKGLSIPTRLPDEAFDATGRQVVQGGRPTGPLGDYGTVASEFDRAQLGQAFWARNFAEATTDVGRQEARLGYAREQMRQVQNMWLESDPTARGGTLFYMERTSNIDKGRMGVRAFSEATPGNPAVDLGPAFSRNVVAAATAASSASASPILEPVRLITPMRFMKAMPDGTVKFMIDDWAAAYPTLAGRKVPLKGGGHRWEGGMNYWGAQSAEIAMNNPNLLDTFMPGIATKTGPYMFLGVDPLNPWATVIDRNAIYLLAGHSRGNVPIFGPGGQPIGTTRWNPKLNNGKGGFVGGINDPFDSQLAHQAGHANNMRIMGGVMDRTGAVTQENTWFGPRIKGQPAIEDSFMLRAQPGRTAETAGGSRSQFYKDLPEAAGVFPVDQDVGWSELVEYAFDGAGSAYGAENAAEVRRIANRNYTAFTGRVSSPEGLSGWQVIDGQVVPDRSSMEFVMPAKDRFAKKAQDVAKELEVVSVEDLMSAGFQPTANPKVRQAVDAMRSADDTLGEFLRRMPEFRAHAIVAALMLGGGAVTANELMARHTLPEPDDAEMLAFLYDDGVGDWA